MKIRNIAATVFFAGLGVVVALWGYFEKLWTMQWPVWTALGVAAVAAVVWAALSLAELAVWVRKRGTVWAVSTFVSVVATIAILVVANWAGTAYNHKWDLTKNKFHSLSDQTTNVLSALKEPITIRVWSTSIERMGTNLDMKRFLENYRLAGKGKVTIEIKNPNEDRLGSEQDQVKRDNILIVRTASGREARVDSFADTKGEELITNAIVQATRGGGTKKTVCFVEGHGEADLDEAGATGMSQVRDALKSGVYDTEKVVTATAEKIPEKCALLVLAGPKGDPQEREIEVIKAYLSGGGKLIALLGAGVPEKWKDFLKDYGVKVRADLMIDPRVRPPFAIATQNFSQDVEIVRGFRGLVVFPESSSLDVASQPNDPEIMVKTFISSESVAYAKGGNLRTLKTIDRTGSDLRGPLALGVLVTKPVKAPGAAKEEKPKAEKPSGKSGAWIRWPSLIATAHAQGAPHSDDDGHDHGHGGGIPGFPPGEEAKDGPKAETLETSVIVYGSSAFVQNSFVSQMGNQDLFLNSVNFLLKDQDLIGIRPREVSQAQLELSPAKLRSVVASVLLISGLFLVFGVAVSRRRSAAA